ncbi:MAG: glycosyltransferase family 4 protein [Clostridiaceae bacterium]
MRILVISQYYYPENFRINDICEELVLRGHQVTVLTGLPNYPEGYVPKDYRYGRKHRETINGVEVLRCFEIGRRTGGFWRALNYFSFMFSGAFCALWLPKDAFDVIYGYAPSPIMQMLAALVYKKRSGKKIVFYSIDVWPAALKAGISGEGLIFRLIKRLSKKIYQESDCIHITSEPFIDYIHDTHDIPYERITYVPQHAEDIYLSEDFTSIENGCADFLFAGNIGAAQDMECIVDACIQLKDLSGWKMHIVGDGSYLSVTQEMVHINDMESFFAFYGRLPISEMPAFYKMADVCMLTLKHDNETGLTLPAKLQSYMAAGKPVIGAIDGSAQDVIKESDCGVCVDAGDSEALASAMRDFILQPQRYAQCGQNGKAYFSHHFTKKIYMEKLLEALERAVL